MTEVGSVAFKLIERFKWKLDLWPTVLSAFSLPFWVYSMYLSANCQRAEQPEEIAWQMSTYAIETKELFSKAALWEELKKERKGAQCWHQPLWNIVQSLDGIHKKFPISECPAIFYSCVCRAATERYNTRGLRITRFLSESSVVLGVTA